MMLFPLCVASGCRHCLLPLGGIQRENLQNGQEAEGFLARHKGRASEAISNHAPAC